jgi:hypothetical protein
MIRDNPVPKSILWMGQPNQKLEGQHMKASDAGLSYDRSAPPPKEAQELPEDSDESDDEETFSDGIPVPIGTTLGNHFEPSHDINPVDRLPKGERKHFPPHVHPFLFEVGLTQNGKSLEAKVVHWLMETWATVRTVVSIDIHRNDDKQITRVTFRHWKTKVVAYLDQEDMLADEGIETHRSVHLMQFTAPNRPKVYFRNYHWEKDLGQAGLKDHEPRFFKYYGYLKREVTVSFMIYSPLTSSHVL